MKAPSHLACLRAARRITVNKTACPKQAFRLNEEAWNDKGSTAAALLLLVLIVRVDKLERGPVLGNQGLPWQLGARTRPCWVQAGLSGEDVSLREG